MIPKKKQPIKKLYVVYVSSGKNIHSVNRSVEIASKIIKRFEDVDLYTVFDTIEPTGYRKADSKIIIVPENFVTPNKTRYKARALYYFHSVINKKGNWALHVDEESIVSPETIEKTLSWIQEADSHTLGQGLITYGGAKFHPIFTAGEGIRSLFDLWIYKNRYSKKTTKPPVVIHGSLMVMNGETGHLFDVGDDGAMAEDTYLANKLVGDGGKINWIDTSIIEQPALNFLDYIAQRTRWYQGLLRISKSPSIKPELRRALFFELMKTTVILPMGSIVVVIGGMLINPLILAIPFITGVFIYSYGLIVTYRYATDLVKNKIIRSLWMLPLSIPVAIIIDCFVGFFAVTRSQKHFKVIGK